jgi:hypothetical protein
MLHGSHSFKYLKELQNCCFVQIMNTKICFSGIGSRPAQLLMVARPVVESAHVPI